MVIEVLQVINDQQKYISTIQISDYINELPIYNNKHYVIYEASFAIVKLELVRVCINRQISDYINEFPIYNDDTHEASFTIAKPELVRVCIIRAQYNLCSRYCANSYAINMRQSLTSPIQV